MAKLEEIMLGLKSQEGDDKKEGFSNALLGQVTPTITAQVPGIENITLGQAPIVSQEGIQYQTQEEAQVSPEALAGLGLGGGVVASQIGGQSAVSSKLSPFAQKIAAADAARMGQRNLPNLIGQPQTTTTTPRLVGPSTAPQYTGPTPGRITPGTQLVPTGQAPAVRSVGGAPAIKPAQVTSLSTIAPKVSALSRAAGPLALYSLADLGVEALTGQGISGRVGEGLGGAIGSLMYGDTSQPAFTPEELSQMQTYEQAQGLPPIQLEALERLSPQPEATFTLPSGEVRSIMPGQDVASAFGRESGRPMTFQVDGGEVTVPSAQAIQTMNLGEQAAARQAQQEFLASPAAREMSNRMLQSVMNDPYAQASAEREARLAAKPDFMRAVSDRERRGTGEMSKAEATRIAEAQGYKGQQARDVADGYITLQRQGRDPMTGKEVEAPFEPKEIEISGKKYIQYTPNYIQPVEEPKAPKKSEIESIREEGVKAGLPENLIRQSIASKLGLDLFDEGVKNWIAGNTDTIPSVEGASESSTFDPTSLTGEDKEAYDWAMANPNAPQSAQILARLSK